MELIVSGAGARAGRVSSAGEEIRPGGQSDDEPTTARYLAVALPITRPAATRPAPRLKPTQARRMP